MTNRDVVRPSAVLRLGAWGRRQIARQASLRAEIEALQSRVFAAREPSSQPQQLTIWGAK